MKKLVLIIFLFTWNAYSQNEHAWIFFKDKANVEEYLANPLSILTSKAIERKQLRGTPIDARDVPVNEAYIAEVKRRNNIQVKARSKWLNCIHVIGSIQDINKLWDLDFVSEIEFANTNLNTRKRATEKRFANKLETSIDYDYGSASNQTLMLNTDFLHKQDLTGKGITIAVMDAGFPRVNSMQAFEKLRAEGGLLGGYDFPNRSSNFSNPALSNHGTLVLSTMAGYLDETYAGTSPDASYYLFITEIGPTETPVEESYWVEAAERADSLGVDMINTSLGYTLFDNPDYSYRPEDMDGKTSFISRGASLATEKGILVVTSAGNRGDASYFNIIGAPADANVLSVGAVDKERNYAFFSSLGPSADGRVKPDVAAQGLEIIAIDQENNLVRANGTSFSSPIMAGSIASLWQLNLSWTNLELMQLVKESASLYNNPNSTLGFGIPDFELAYISSLEPEEPEAFMLYPNPTQNFLRFTNSSGEPYKVTIFDTLGQKLLQQENVEKEIDLSGFPKGIYIVMFEQKNSRRSHLIIKK